MSRGAHAIVTCPWSSKYQRDSVYHKLFEGDDDAKIEGLNEIATWKFRTFPRISQGLEITEALVAASLFARQVQADDNHKGRLGVMERICLTHMFSSTITRFINLVTEVGQVSGYNKAIAGIAEQMNVPEWIVDLRHSASHGAMPALGVLLTAVEWALQWVKINYWDSENSLLSDIDNSCSIDEQKIESSLRLIRSKLFDEIENERPELQNKSNIIQVLKPPSKKSRALWKRRIVDILVHDGYLLPYARHLRMLVAKAGASRDGVFRILSKVWRPVLEDLVELGLTWPTVTAFADNLPKLKCVEVELSLCWVAVLLENTKESSKPKMRPGMNWSRICKSVLACSAEPMLIERVLNLVKREFRMPHLKFWKKIVAAASPGMRKYLQQSWLQSDFTNGYSAKRLGSPTETTSNELESNSLRFVPVLAEEIKSVWNKGPLGVLPQELNNRESNQEFPTFVDEVDVGVASSSAMSKFVVNRERVTPCYLSDISERPTPPIFDANTKVSCVTLL